MGNPSPFPQKIQGFGILVGWHSGVKQQERRPEQPVPTRSPLGDRLSWRVGDTFEVGFEVAIDSGASFNSVKGLSRYVLRGRNGPMEELWLTLLTS